MISHLSPRARAFAATRVDWFRLLADLKRSGLSLYDIERETSIPTSTLGGYIDGAEPRYANGERLIDLWLRKTGRNVDTLPRELEPISAAKA